MSRFSLHEAERLAQKFRFDNGLSMSEPLSMKSILRKTNVITLYRPLSPASFGMSAKTPNGKMFMLVNSNTTRGRQHFTIAHELYHLFYDASPSPHMCGTIARGAEKEANLFASALLMPREGLFVLMNEEELRGEPLQLATVLRIEQLFGVSRKSLLVRLKALDVIDERRLKQMEETSAKASAQDYGYDTSLYENGNEGVVIGDFGEKARRLLDGGKISEGHYVELINVWLYGGKED